MEGNIFNLNLLLELPLLERELSNRAFFSHTIW